MSPLSSSLSAIVADSLRRGIHESPSSAAAARRRPKLDALKRYKSQRRPMEAEDVGSPLKGRHGSESGDGEEGARKQSISAALGEFLKLKFRRERDAGGGEGE
ncbi:MAG: hypothetical protein Q9204_008969, partial [Flavoplaca sp. TL-2023a]